VGLQNESHPLYSVGRRPWKLRPCWGLFTDPAGWTWVVGAGLEEG
jgi:hypothetical protein